MVLFSAAIFLPPLGIFFSIFCPIPIILAYLYSGQKIGMKSLLAATTFLFLISNFQLAIIFFVEYGLVAVIMAESIRRNYSIDKITVFCVGVTLLLGGSLLYLLIINKGINLTEIMAEQIKHNIDSSIHLYKEMGLTNSDIDNIRLYSKKLAPTFTSLIPALMIVSSSVGVFFNYLLVKIFWNKYVKRGNYFQGEDLRKWSAPDYLIWLLISSGIILLIPVKSINAIGLNMLIVTLLIYFFQGMAIVFFYMKKKTFPFFLKVFIYVIILIQPLLLFFVIFLGIFDLWIDFRKLKDNKLQL